MKRCMEHRPRVKSQSYVILSLHTPQDDHANATDKFIIAQFLDPTLAKAAGETTFLLPIWYVRV